MPAVIGKLPSVWAGALVLGILPACVPGGPSTADAGAPAKPTVVPPAPAKPATTVAQVARPDGPEHARITAPFEDNFNRAELGPDWNVLGAAWKLQNGRLCVRGARNKGAW